MKSVYVYLSLDLIRFKAAAAAAEAFKVRRKTARHISFPTRISDEK